MLNTRHILFSIVAFVAALSAYADNYVVVGKEAKVFDEPNAKGYVTLNTKNAEVVMKPGMAFKSMEKSQGWYLIEYSPGLRGYISEQVVIVPSQSPAPGTFTVSNAPNQKISVSGGADKWKATIGEKNYNGKSFGNAVVFFDEKGNPGYSLVMIQGKPVVMTYDNNITKFF